MAADGCGFDGPAAVRAEAFAAFDRRLDPKARAPLVVGLSGGSDSLALLAIALDWARARERPVLALTVDHGLTADSAGWTAQAGGTARRLGAVWRALAWDGPKPSAGLPAAARRARHALLADAARAAGASVLLLGHTADDVAESELIRQETPGHGRMTEWAPSPVWPQGRDVFLLRPLLGVRREALRALLTSRGVGWLEDPANTDRRFARARARQRLSEPPLSRPLEGRVEVGGRRTAPASYPTSVAASRVPLPAAASAPHPAPPPRGEGEEISTAGVISLDAGGLGLNPRRLAHAIVCAAGGETPPSGPGLGRLVTRVAAAAAGTATLGGARIAFDGGTVTLRRELGRRPCAPLALAAREPAVFDGRFELVADAPGWRVAPLAGHAAALSREDRRRLCDVPAAARPALPVLLGEDGAPRLPRPFGDGPAYARELVSARFAAAIGRVDSERALARDLRGCAVHGA